VHGCCNQAIAQVCAVCSPPKKRSGVTLSLNFPGFREATLESNESSLLFVVRAKMGLPMPLAPSGQVLPTVLQCFPSSVPHRGACWPQFHTRSRLMSPEKTYPGSL
jgi:hypothetical protein